MYVPLALVNPLLEGPSLLANPAAPAAPLEVNMIVEVNTTTSLCSMSIATPSVSMINSLSLPVDQARRSQEAQEDPFCLGTPHHPTD